MLIYRVKRLERDLMDVDEAYRKLRERYSEEELEKMIEATVKELRYYYVAPKREDAIIYLARKLKFQKPRVPSKRARMVFKGKTWRIRYMKVDNFPDDLEALGRFLEKLEEDGEKIVSVMPAVGPPRIFISIGTSSGLPATVIGFIVISRVGKVEDKQGG
ncbi:MAG: hypothetical protein DRJ47_01845 [Thermoprotei archaeon]|nr:MAG: hypothetical protein DRJ47_01845 [Thermoprotei archaeon]